MPLHLLTPLCDLVCLSLFQLEHQRVAYGNYSKMDTSDWCHSLFPNVFTSLSGCTVHC
jgi:hypothetical protein